MQKYQYSCNYCHHFIETCGPWPYYKDQNKKVRFQSYTDVSSGGIYGLIADIYCPLCDKQKEYTIVEFEKPLKDVSDIWLSNVTRKIKMICHKCRNPVFLTLPPNFVRCPRCKKGTFDVYEPMAGEEAESFPVPPPVSPLRIRQGGKPVRIPKPTIVIDSAEHLGYTFGRFTNWFSGSVRKRLKVGDYTILGMEDEIAVERKTVPDLVKSIIQERNDFIQKCEKLSTFRKKCLVIEGTLGVIKTPYEDSNAHPNAVLGSLVAAQERWDIPIHFLDNLLLAEEFVASMLSKYHAYRWLETNGFERYLIEGDI